MTPRAKNKRTPADTRLKERGQLSIFLGIIMLIIFSMIAFIVNVGLFVKAKINLQNAVDAAAYAGAATQARQLTNIGYLNWELRNTFKEWMFKYYVLGQMGLPKTRGNPTLTPVQSMDFTLKQFSPPGSSLELTLAGDYDHYNVPSICIHFGQFNHNICEIYDVPGLPRFPAPGLPNIQEAHEEFLKNITSTKAKDCSVRSNVNFATALQWAFGTKSQIIDEATLIASTRMGAWPQALELGMRMRNLEYIVNNPPHPQPLCILASGCDNIESVSESSDDPILGAFSERKTKAFWSAYRSLAGGSNKESERELAANFKMTELPPEPFVADDNTVSSFLIPNDKNFASTGAPATTKHYLDLQAYPINFATFYTSFITKNSTLDGTIQVEGTCAGTKTALPVPGYLLGFVKNPEVMTYYAVKGESKYIGMFYPFAEQEGIVMEAYGAAKPFGGRIGPRLFDFNDTKAGVKARDDSDNKISSPYVAGVNSSQPSYAPGYPLPTSNTFWVSTPDDVIGGVPSSNASNAKFVMPNMLYDAWPDKLQSDLNAQKDANVTKILIITERAGADQYNPNERVGFYNREQFLSLRASLPEGIGSSPMSGEQVHEAMNKARRPTFYEALNYMIPTYEENPGSNNQQQTSPSISVRDLTGTGPGGARMYALFAPLFGTNTLYSSVAEIEKVVQDYIDNNSTAINSFRDALSQAAASIRASGGASESGDSNIYAEAANTIFNPLMDAGPINESASMCDRVSMFAKFNHFFTQDDTRCGIDSLKMLMVEYINQSQANDTSTTYNYDNFYKSSFFAGYEFQNDEVGLRGPTNLEVSTAYVPGPRQNATEAGMEKSAITGSETGRSLKRNLYSTKFFAIEKVLDSGDHPYGDPMIFMERTGLQEWPDFTGIDIVNKLPASALQGFYGPDH